MSLDSIDAEITRRLDNSAVLLESKNQMIKAAEQFQQIDNINKKQENNSRTTLESIYKELRHFTGQWPVVYSAETVEFYPFFQGQGDSDCNPYYPITKIQDKTFDGIAPLQASINKTGAHARARFYANSETSTRTTAMMALEQFPDTSEEVGVDRNAGQQEEEGGPPHTFDYYYPVGTTATEKLRAALIPWRDEIIILKEDLYKDAYLTYKSFWEDLLSNINSILNNIKVDVVWPATTDSSIAGPSRGYLLANKTVFESSINQRTLSLSQEAELEEDIFYNIVRLRLHQVNGTFTKLKMSKNQTVINDAIIADNDMAIKTLNSIKIKSSQSQP